MASYSEFASFYDEFLGDFDYKARAEYFNSIINKHVEGQKLLLDLACGTGSLSVEMAKLGYDVIGVDASIEMLSVAQEKAYDQEISILFLNQTMQQLDLYGTINCCVCGLDSLNHIIEVSELEQAISKVSLFLEKGGVFVFDMNSPYKHREVLGDNCFIYEHGSTLCAWQNKTDENMLTQVTLDFFSKQENGLYDRCSECFYEKGYEIETVTNILEKCGFGNILVYGEDSFLPPTENTERFIFVAVKER